MKCPFCGFENDKVVDSRESKEADSIRRRRECLKCEKRFTTYERIDEIPYMVVKKDGRRERFDRQKVLNGLMRAYVVKHSSRFRQSRARRMDSPSLLSRNWNTVSLSKPPKGHFK